MEQFCHDKKHKIAIVGAGPSGIYCALQILFGLKEKNYNNFSIDIFDKNQALRTILATGAGRCNITNSTNDVKEFCKNYPRGEKFLYSIFSRHFNLDSLEFFKQIGIKTYTQEDGRIFPKSNSAKEVKDKMLEALFSFKNAKLINKKINSKDSLKNYDYIIISTGSRDAVELLQSFNQPFKPFKKALCALIVENYNFPKGVSIKSLDGDFIFTDTGISGPLAFKISSLKAYEKMPYNISINLFKPEELEALIKENTKKSIGNLISYFIPKSVAKAIVKDFDRKAAEISKQKIIEYSKLNLTIINTTNQGEIVNAGGVELNSIDKNCKSKVYPNLWFCGEVLDIDGFCGGFNLQNCWSSAYVAAQDVINSVIQE